MKLKTWRRHLRAYAEAYSLVQQAGSAPSAVEQRQVRDDARAVMAREERIIRISYVESEPVG